MKLIDPRVSITEERVKNIKNILAFGSGKGGVGKSTLSTFTSLILKEKGFKVGLLDLDLYGPSSHLILDGDHLQPKEDYGIKPVEIDGIHFMSIIYFTQNKPLAMRGKEVSDSIIELFTITKWDDLDYLIIDMPPGMGETLLDLINIIKRLEFILISNSTRFAMETVTKLAMFLKEQNIPIVGLIENMKNSNSDFVKNKCEELQIKYLGKVSYYQDLEDYYGKTDELLKSPISKEIAEVASFIP
ncbi:MAG TPA: P-loop NTPase [Dictyoglomaceae bacterium]|nr:P-loop NTPase [Dictyoglomaceae bacterium]HOL39772.1 P-loop NTPase [Dictyoglomaceae bacterium]HPP16248.1 P-loop NTPase [Dictyoglomaceae bacterium]